MLHCSMGGVLTVMTSRNRAGFGSAVGTGDRRGPGRVAPGQGREVDPGEAEIVEIAVVEPVQLVQRPLVADPLPGPKHQPAEEALLRIARVAEKRRIVGKTRFNWAS